jgi:hypothetical protein
MHLLLVRLNLLLVLLMHLPQKAQLRSNPSPLIIVSPIFADNISLLKLID